MENNQLSEQPPFELQTGGDSPLKRTTYQDSIYNDALRLAQLNKDPNPQTFAQSVVDSTKQAYGKNNPFGELAGKHQPGTFKNGIKYRDFPNSTVPLSKKYQSYLQEQHNAQMDEDEFAGMIDTVDPNEMTDDNFEEPTEDMVEQPQDIPQESYEQPTQSQQISSPGTSLSVYDRNYSDQAVQRNNPVSQLDATNPIQGFAYGGKMGPTSDKDLNTFNGGGTHEQNPLGGIPQGMNQNGTPNTVEEHETSVDLNGQKFIFSNRIFI